MPSHTANLANLAPLESDPSQPDRDDTRFTFAPGLTLAANDEDAIIENAFAIYRTAMALGMSPPELNSFCDIKFQDETSAMKKWLVARKGNFGQPDEPQVDITWKPMIHLIHKPDCISTAQMNAGLPFAMSQRVTIDLLPIYYNIVCLIASDAGSVTAKKLIT